MTRISQQLVTIHNRIHAACNACGRDPAGVRLLAVSKTVGADAVIDAVLAGQCAFGENYAAEGVEKIATVRTRLGGGGGALEWHCIGPLQSNKTRLVAEHFDWMQSLDRLKIAQRLSEQRPPGLAPLQICLQVNIDGGANKSGVAPANLIALATEVAQLPNLSLRGLMAIPEPAISFMAARAIHTSVKALFDQLNGSGKLAVTLDTLSLGMTADLEAAIHAGSTMVRVGTAIFGPR